MKQPELYERMKEVKLLVEEKRVNNVELLQQELDLLHQGLKEEAAKGTSRRRTRGGPAMAAEAAAALKEGAESAKPESDAAPPKAVGSAEDGDDERGKGRGEETGTPGQGEVASEGQGSEKEQLVEGDTQVATPKAALQRGGRNKRTTAGSQSDAG